MTENINQNRSNGKELDVGTSAAVRNTTSTFGVSFETLVRNLIDDKYNREYKLDRKTRTKAIEILNDFYAKN